MKIEAAKLNPGRTVGEIASEFPMTMSVFEKLKIDYCCGGNRKLSEACALAGLQAQKVIGDLEKAVADREDNPGVLVDWNQKTIHELTEYILGKHHVYTRTQLVRLKGLSTKVLGAHGLHHPELSRLDEIINLMAEEMEGHMAKEEEQVFPYLCALEDFGGKKEAVLSPFGGGPLDVHPLKVLMWEHGMTGEEWIEIHKLTEDFNLPPEACRSFQALYLGLKEMEDDLHQHVHLENNILFAKAMERGWLD